MSGTRATFTTTKDATPTRDQMQAAFEKKNMKLVMFTREVRQRPVLAHVATVTGLG